MSIHRQASVQHTRLCCLPNRCLPETTCLNKCNNDEYQRLFLCFDLLPDARVEDIQSTLRTYCSYQLGTQTLSTETCLIEWLDEKNLSWFGMCVLYLCAKRAVKYLGLVAKNNYKTRCRSQPAK